jgi:hypothetical protein
MVEKSATGVNDTGGNIATGINDTGGKFAQVSRTPVANFSTILASVVDTGGKYPPVSMILAANLPPVSTMPVANCHRYQQRRRQICHQWQTMGTIIKLLTT